MLSPSFQSAAFEPHVLRQHRLFESFDLDDTRERISRVMQPHTLHPLQGAVPGGRSHMDFLRLGSIGMGSIVFGQAMRVDVDAVEDYHLLMFCLQGHADALADGRATPADASRGMICAPGRSFHADLSPDCEQFVLRLDRTMVEAHCGRAVHFREELDLRRPALRAWLDQLRVLATSPALMASAQQHPLIAVELERLLIMLLLDGQGEYDDAPSPSRSIAPVCVRRAERYMEEHAADPLRLADIASAADVPARTLLEAFKRFRDTSPMQHLRELRLERAHQLLVNADESTQVATVALDCGFTHLSRFAQAYRVRYGRPPSATLAARH